MHKHKHAVNYANIQFTKIVLCMSVDVYMSMCEFSCGLCGMHAHDGHTTVYVRIVCMAVLFMLGLLMLTPIRS